jgi:hypothetical protein
MSLPYNLYNTSTLENDISSILGYIDLLKQEKITDIFQIEMEVMKAYPDFYDQFPFLVKRLCKGEDLAILFKMIEGLKKVESGEKTLTQVELPLGQELAEEYLYPHLSDDDSSNLSDDDSSNSRPSKKPKK